MERFLRVSLFTCLLFGIAYSGIIEPLECPGVANRVTDLIVEVSDCDSGSNCTLYKGTTYYLKTTFTPTQGFQDANMRTLGVMGRLKVPYMGNNAVCEEATTEDGENCDPAVGLVEGKAYTHIKDFPVRRIYPEMTMKARVEYFHGHRPTRRSFILCYEVPIKIEAPPESENEVQGS